MRQLALINAPYKVLLLAGLLACCVLTGCASTFEEYYQPAAASNVAPVTPPPAPLLIQSRYPDADAKQLEQEGYELIGTSYFITGQLATGPLSDSFYTDQAVKQGKKVGAAIVLLQVDDTAVLGDGCCRKIFASYWADLARRRAVM
jgi:hypothetical protein